jgi:hypothetical protein
MLNYFYTGEYKESIDEDKELRRQVLVQSLTYNLADKYEVPILMELVKKRFRSTLNKGPTPAEYLSIVSDIYTIPAPTNAFRVITVKYARRKFREIMQDDGNLEVVRATLQAVPDFNFDVLQAFVNDPL